MGQVRNCFAVELVKLSLNRGDTFLASADLEKLVLNYR